MLSLTSEAKSIPLTFQDPASVLDLENATAGFSAGAQIFYDAFVSGGRTVKGVIALLTLPLLAVFFSGLSQLAATSRIVRPTLYYIRGLGMSTPVRVV